ncbi:MAG: YeeE/YedE thiosulfate transporter family protein [Kiritimatiellia bacterium]
MQWKTADGGWNPYIAGALVGALAVVSAFATTKLMDKTNYLGASTTFVRAAGFVEKAVAPGHVAANEYFTKTKVSVDWQFMLVVGVFIGALIGSLSDGSFKREAVPPTWENRFGPSVAKRAAGAIVGGMIAMIGARMADGCPSGHGLSGMMQLTTSSFVALPLFFIGGIVVANLVYRRKGK